LDLRSTSVTFFCASFLPSGSSFVTKTCGAPLSLATHASTSSPRSRPGSTAVATPPDESARFETTIGDPAAPSSSTVCSASVAA